MALIFHMGKKIMNILSHLEKPECLKNSCGLKNRTEH